MIFLFKRNLFIYSLLLLPYACLVRIKSFFPNGQGEEISEPICSSLWGQFIDTVFPSDFLQSSVAVLLIFFQAVMLNRIVIKNRITKAYTLFPGMFYILLTSVFYDNLGLNVYTVANTFAIASISASFSIYKRFKPEVSLFRSGFWTGMAALFAPFYILLLVLNFVALSSLRTFSVKEMTQIIIGLAAPLITSLAVLYYFEIPGFWKSISIDHFGRLLIPALSIEIIFVIIILLLILIVIFMNGTFQLRKSLPSKKKISILYILLLTTPAVLLANCGMNINILYYLWIPMSIFVSMLVINFKNLAITELLHLAIIAFIINNHFQFIQLM